MSENADAGNRPAISWPCRSWRPCTGSLYNVLWASDEREAPSMNPHAVANTVRALAKRSLRSQSAAAQSSR
jgi:hypothetical protein